MLVAIAGQFDQRARILREGAFAVGDDGIDLHQRTQRQGGDGEGGAGRQITREEFAIDGVDRLQIRHLFQEDGGFDHIVHHVANALYDGLEVIQALSGLYLDIATYHFARLGSDR